MVITIKKFYDTCALLESVGNKQLFQEYFCVSSVTLHELEHIKTSRHKGEDVRYKARKITRLLDENSDKFGTVPYSNRVNDYINDILGLDTSIPDNRIIGTAKWMSLHDDIIFVTNDICCKVIAKNELGLKVESVECKDEVYKGYKEISGSAEQINMFMENIDYDDWCINEYLIIHGDDGTDREMRFNGETFVPLKLPPSKNIKAKNSLQRCALDILNNPDITVAAILGDFGSGKTHLALQMALYCVVEKGYQSKILGVRSPQGEGKEIGYLPGNITEKTGGFYLPLAQQLRGGEFELENLKQCGTLDINIPFYMKGTTYNNTIMVVDEAEDLDEKQLRLVGTRIGMNSRIFFSGDYKQSVVDMTDGNPLIRMCDKFKGDKRFATIYLEEDVRSSTSKMFAHLFQE